MVTSLDRAAMVGQLQSSLLAFCAPVADDLQGLADIQEVLQLMSGVLVETHLLFEQPETGLVSSLHKILHALGPGDPADGYLEEHCDPCALDGQMEQGRMMAKELFEEWLDCTYEFHKFIETFTIQSLLLWEEEGLTRHMMYRYLYDSAVRSMALEIAAQELCDVVIDELIGGWGWTVLDAVAGLSALSGHKLALSALDHQGCQIFRGADIPEHMDRIVHVMTQEAVRYGTPVGSDWRFGLAANDIPPNPPWEILSGVEPLADRLLGCLPFSTLEDHAAACAKAAGRMIAVASGGEDPEYDSAIVKPMAMAALTESYKNVCGCSLAAKA